jgi:uncharacterized lipoprotein
MRRVGLSALLLLLAGCSSLSGVEGQLDESECSLNSVPICIPIGGHSGTA